MVVVIADNDVVQSWWEWIWWYVNGFWMSLVKIGKFDFDSLTNAIWFNCWTICQQHDTDLNVYILFRSGIVGVLIACRFVCVTACVPFSSLLICWRWIDTHTSSCVHFYFLRLMCPELKAQGISRFLYFIFFDFIVVASSLVLCMRSDRPETRSCQAHIFCFSLSQSVSIESHRKIEVTKKPKEPNDKWYSIYSLRQIHDLRNERIFPTHFSLSVSRGFLVSTKTCFEWISIHQWQTAAATTAIWLFAFVVRTPNETIRYARRKSIWFYRLRESYLLTLTHTHADT